MTGRPDIRIVKPIKTLKILNYSNGFWGILVSIKGETAKAISHVSDGDLIKFLKIFIENGWKIKNG